jgi:hypothetical protein
MNINEIDYGRISKQDIKQNKNFAVISESP